MKAYDTLIRISISLVLFFCFLEIGIKAQVIERERPAEWSNLVNGGRFMDRFLPIPVNGSLTSDTWGAEQVIPRYINNGLEDCQWSYWGGKAISGADGLYHLFVCRWPENSEKGHMAWPNSIVVHATASNSLGPYTVQETIGKGHNPELFQLADGRYVIYVYGGYYLSRALGGPWEYKQFQFDARDRKVQDGLSNLTFAKREDGAYLMIYRGGGVWVSQTGLSPWQQITQKRVYPAVEGHFEDPLVWRTNIQYHMIVNDWYGRIAYYLRSKDGVHWKVDPGEAYMPGIANYTDGTEEQWFKYERIKVLQDEYGRATQAHFAVIDTIKWNDLPNDRHSSKHICIPLTVGKHMTLLNKKINDRTKTIKVRIAAEPGFNPHADMDIAGLQLGAPERVNFGKGCKVIATQKDGDDLILTFDAAGNGLTDDNFVIKLLGQTINGQLLFAYARLPWVDYQEPVLSARLPVIKKDEENTSISIEIQNFGEVPSHKAMLCILMDNGNGMKEIATGKIKSLAAFEKTVLTWNPFMGIKKGQTTVKVVIKDAKQVIEELTGELLIE